MGSFMDYKNVEVLIKGMARLPGYELNLLSKISEERKSELQALVPENASVIFHDGVSESEYHSQLAQAVALVSGSRDEGFGIPLVEAMNLGVPVVVSDIDIFREIGGDAAIYFDCEDPESFSRSVLEIQNEGAWLQRSKASQLQAAKFSWTKSAASLLDLLKQI
jgi:glycosyltransferase involved in cell wall biosynthesis